MTDLKVINMVDVPLLKLAGASVSDPELESWVPAIKSAMSWWGIDTVREVASFLANAMHESGGLRQMEENLNYRAERLMQVWPKRFPNLAVAQQYAHNPEKLANKVYSGRMGNSDEASGDGWRYRGYGLFQLTGKSNQSRFGAAIGKPLDQVPAYLRTKEGAAMSAGWYWHDNGLDAKAATPGLADDRQAIQGGTLGLAEVTAVFDKVVHELLRRGA